MSNPIDTREFRDALGQFATGVTIVTAVDADGTPIGMTASSFNSVSLDPALVLWSIEKKAKSFTGFTQADHYVIHVLSAEQAELCWAFAAPGPEKFTTINTTTNDNGVPMISDYVARFECASEHRYDGGDHIILVGRVLCFDYTPGAPLLYHQGDLKTF